MSKRRVELRVEALERGLLEGVLDPSDENRRVPVDVGIVPWFEDERPLQGLGGFLDWRSHGWLSQLVRTGWCTGEPGESVLLPWTFGPPVRRLVFVGFGMLGQLDPERAASSAARAVAVANRLKAEDVLFAMPARLQERALIEVMFDAVATALERGDGRQDTAPRFRSVVGAAPRLAPADEHPVGDIGGSDDLSSDADEAEDTRPPALVAELHPTPQRWWVAVDARHVARLRRLLEGPPRAAES